MIHPEPHPLAGKTVRIKVRSGETISEENFVVKDWWDRLSPGNKPWGECTDYTSMNYGLRAGLAGLPEDAETVYGKLFGLGYLLHVSELPESEASEPPEPKGDEHGLQT